MEKPRGKEKSMMICQGPSCLGTRPRGEGLEGEEVTCSVASSDLFREPLSNCIRVKESRFLIWGDSVLMETLIAKVPAKLTC